MCEDKGAIVRQSTAYFSPCSSLTVQPSGCFNISSKPLLCTVQGTWEYESHGSCKEKVACVLQYQISCILLMSLVRILGWSCCPALQVGGSMPAITTELTTLDFYYGRFALGFRAKISGEGGEGKGIFFTLFQGQNSVISACVLLTKSHG